MSMDLELRLGEGAWHLFQIRANDERFESFKAKVHARDENQCQFCGFRSSVHMRVLNANHNYKDNREQNMITACPFCAQVHFLEMIGMADKTGGTMIYFPEMSQVEINALCHVAFCAIANSGEHAQSCQNLYNSLKLRSKYVEEHVGKGLSAPSMLGQMLIDTPLDHKEYVYEEVTRDLRVLPALDAFASYISDWSEAAMHDLI